MGVIHIDGEVRGPDGTKEAVRFLVDSGATYSLLAKRTWQALGLVAKRTAAFSLADGTQVERRISECHITLPQGDGHTPVILGEGGDQPLLGVVTLEELGLSLHPFKRILQPMKLLA